MEGRMPFVVVMIVLFNAKIPLAIVLKETLNASLSIIIGSVSAPAVLVKESMKLV